MIKRRKVVGILDLELVLQLNPLSMNGRDIVLFRRERRARCGYHASTPGGNTSNSMEQTAGTGAGEVLLLGDEPAGQAMSRRAVCPGRGARGTHTATTLGAGARTFAAFVSPKCASNCTLDGWGWSSSHTSLPGAPEEREISVI
jgi:hypothetical protein